ncbi:autophagy-related protein 16-1-like [Saccoglossus kowalevskii]|uniref:Autophagy-related protein 16-1-like n=1 Tax=Saccoglossus kowalevskii TaxID=10224 RepID=A0ABM0MGK6_SACKO|nr:PREDICTED: autophagy-related protein 16-1-like [Saccoglossus kowalevskii]
MADAVGWKRNLRKQLRQRNRVECEYFKELINNHNKIFEGVDSMRTQNVALQIQVERLKQENLDLNLKSETSSSGNGGGGKASNEKIQSLEQKLFKLQEELTEMHRRKGENAQQLIDVSHELQEKEKLLTSKDTKLTETLFQLDSLRNEMKHLEDSIIEKETAYQLLRDEHQALQLACTSAEEKLRVAKEENTELITRWMELKGKQAEFLNFDNEEYHKKQRAKLKQDLKEAAETHVDIKQPKIRPQRSGSQSMQICYQAIIPTHAHYKFDAHDGEVNAVRFTLSGRICATGGADRKIKLWEYGNGQLILKGSLMGSNAGVMCVDFDSQEHHVLGASNDFASRVWSIADHRLRHTLTGHSGKVLAAKFFGDASKVVSGSHDRTLKVWDLRSKACIRTIFAGSSCNDLVTSEAAGSTIISGHFDKKVRFFDTRSDTCGNEITLQGRVTSLDLSPDRTMLLSSTREDSLKVIDLRMNQVISTCCADGFHVGNDYSRAVFSPDGQYTLAGSQDGSVFIWNTATGKLETRLMKEHHSSVVAVAWQPSGAMVISCDRTKKAILWSDI